MSNPPECFKLRPETLDGLRNGSIASDILHRALVADIDRRIGEYAEMQSRALKAERQIETMHEAEARHREARGMLQAEVDRLQSKLANAEHEAAQATKRYAQYVSPEVHRLALDERDEAIRSLSDASKRIEYLTGRLARYEHSEIVFAERNQMDKARIDEYDRQVAALPELHQKGNSPIGKFPPPGEDNSAEANRAVSFPVTGDSGDLMERLRQAADWESGTHPGVAQTCLAAAREIEQLRAALALSTPATCKASDDELRFQWLCENYAYVMVKGLRGMEHMADPTGMGDLRAAIDAWTEKLAGLRPHAQGKES